MTNNNTTIYTVTHHHHVLIYWAELRQKMKKAPRLVTLDHHTDTSPPFRNYLKQLHESQTPKKLPQTARDLIQATDFQNLASVEEAVEKLSHDEHVMTAIQSGIISSALVIAQNARDTDLQCYREHQVICCEVKDSQWNDVLENSLLDNALSFFEKILNENNETLFNDSGYILDIDLDYFKTFRSATPANSSTFRQLVQNAKLVTIATEPEYVKSCAVDQGLTSDILLEKIMTLIG